MDLLLPLLLGFLSGLLYNEHIYRQSLKFPRSRPYLSFFVRFSILGTVALAVALIWDAEGLLFFLGGNLAGRFLHTFLRAFVIVRY